jgi:hypothetical protein
MAKAGDILGRHFAVVSLDHGMIAVPDQATTDIEGEIAARALLSGTALYQMRGERGIGAILKGLCCIANARWRRW